MIHLVVPGKPQGKARPRVVRTKGGFPRAFTPDKTVNYEAFIKSEFARKYGGFAPLLGPVDLRLCVYIQIPKGTSKKRARLMEATVIRPTTKPDADNVLKLFSDALNGLAYRDDAQAVEMLAQKYYSHTPRVEVWVRAMPEPLASSQLKRKERKHDY